MHFNLGESFANIFHSVTENHSNWWKNRKMLGKLSGISIWKSSQSLPESFSVHLRSNLIGIWWKLQRTDSASITSVTDMTPQSSILRRRFKLMKSYDTFVSSSNTKLRISLLSSLQSSGWPINMFVSLFFPAAALKTQPYDLLRWSAAYFRCLSLDVLPPVKPRYEHENVFGCLTKGYLKVLLSQVRECSIHVVFHFQSDLGCCLLPATAFNFNYDSCYSITYVACFVLLHGSF